MNPPSGVLQYPSSIAVERIPTPDLTWDTPNLY